MSDLTEFQPRQFFKTSGGTDDFKPYDHQTASWDALEKHFDDNKKKSGILVVPTGGGKTAIATRWLMQHHIAKGGRVLWFAHRQILLKQAFRAMAEAVHLAAPKKKVGLIAVSSEYHRLSQATPDLDAIFLTINTATRENNIGYLDTLAQQSPKGLFVVVDEAHHAAAKGYRRVLERLKELGCPILGLTATPVRMDENDTHHLWRVFEGGVVYQIPKSVLVHKGILATPKPATVDTKVDIEAQFTAEDIKYLETFGDYGPAVLARLGIDVGRNKLIVEHYLKNKELFGPTIVFGVNTLHAQTLAQEFKAAGVDADYVDYTRRDSLEVMERYKAGKPVVLANVAMLTEGFDAPRTRTIFIARPTRSESLLTQMIGRALRGELAGGNKFAYLITFVDTWKQFTVLDTQYTIEQGEPVDLPTKPNVRRPVIIIPDEVVREVYRLFMSRVKGSFEGQHQCLPYGWYIWEAEFEDDTQQRVVLVFENQKEAFEGYIKVLEGQKGSSDISKEYAEHLVQEHFGGCPDPLPRWTELKDLWDAYRNECEVLFYSFEDKKEFDPKLLAQELQNLTPPQQSERLHVLWDRLEACRKVYRNDFRTFGEDVNREVSALTYGVKPTAEPQVVKIVPKTLRAWPALSPGYSLVELRETVYAQRRHFPNGPPSIQSLEWREMRGYWGFFRYSDKALSVNTTLNSPDVPRFVMECLMYHELLHADMPNAAHNADYRERERRFVPSEEAIAQAAALGVFPSKSTDAWRNLATQFLDTFEFYYCPDTQMLM